MRYHQTIPYLLILPAVIMGCAGTYDRPEVGESQRDSGAGKAAKDSSAAPAFKDGGGPAPKIDAMAATPDKSLKPDQWQPPPVKSDQFVTPTPTGCPNGNLLAAYPKLPKLCRPFPAPSPGTAPKEPSSCTTTPQKTLTSGSAQFTGQGYVKDHIRAMDGDDTLKGMECNDIMNGNMGNDFLNGNKGNDELHGGSGNDTVHGGADNDLIYGDLDNDALYGDLGDDRYYFSEGEGYDTVEESSGYDMVVCTTNTGRPRARLLSWQRFGNDLLLIMSGGTTVRVKQYYSAAMYSIDAIIGCQ